MTEVLLALVCSGSTSSDESGISAVVVPSLIVAWRLCARYRAVTSRKVLWYIMLIMMLLCFVCSYTSGSNKPSITSVVVAATSRPSPSYWWRLIITCRLCAPYRAVMT